MRPFRQTVALLVSAAVVLLLASAAQAPAAQMPFEASFSAAPEAPKRGEQITLTATTRTPYQGPMDHAWDLDGDRLFDDAVGPTATVTFDTPGEHVVRLRSRQVPLGSAGPITDVAERTFTIAPDAPPAPPTTPTIPAEEPRPAPPATQPTPPANAAPTAEIDRGCKRHGQMRVCSATFAYQGSKKTLSAEPSTDADGQIVRYEWDLDGNGTFERETGAAPTVEHVFEPRTTGHYSVPVREWEVSVRVTDNGGATATAALPIEIKPARCEPEVKIGQFTATGACLRPYNGRRDGKDVVRYLSEGPVSLNGMAIQPQNGREVSFELPRNDSGAGLRISSSNATVSMNAGGTYAVVTSGEFAWTPQGKRLDGFQVDAHALINGLKLTRVVGEPELKNGQVQAQVYVAMPAQFGGATSASPVTLGAGVPRAAADAFSFTVPAAALGPIGLDTLVVSYDGVNLWEITATVALPAPASVDLRGAAGIRDTGKFVYAEAEAKWAKGFALGGPTGIFLERIKFRIEVDPGEKAGCVPNVGKKKRHWPTFVQKPEGIPDYIDYGYPTFALCGEVALTAGPPVDGKAAARLTAGLGWATYADRPWVLRAFGNLDVADVPLAKAEVEVYGDGYIHAQGEVKTTLGGVASIEGGLELEIYKSKFNASGRVEACVSAVDVCAGAQAIVSSRGLAACLKLKTGFGTWRPGIGYLWGEPYPDVYFSGCSIGPYREKIDHKASAAQAGDGSRSFDIPGGLPGTALVVKGDGTRPPRVTITGPGGRTIRPLESGRKSLMADDYVLVEDPRTNTTQVLIAKPAAGRWTVSPEAGSAPVTEVLAADGLDAPEVTASVAGDGAERVLRYRVKPVAGQKVTFVERGGTAGGEVGTARGAEGELRFTPAEGAAEKRQVVALIEQDGRLREERVVASFQAAKATRLARAQRLTVVRRGGAVVAAWKPVKGAAAYTVQARLGNGRTVVRQVRAPRLRAAGAGRRGRAQVTVRAISRTGVPGLPVTVASRRPSR